MKNLDYKFIIVPLVLWFLIQFSKVIVDICENKKFSLRRLFGAGGMPSSHSAIITTVATMIGKYEGVNTPIFALALAMALIVMHDAIGVRRQVGKQAKFINDILLNKEYSNEKKFQEMVGHTPIQVCVGCILGIITGLSF